MLSREDATQRLRTQGAFGAAVLQGSLHGANSHVAQNFVNEHTKNLFSLGKIRPESAKRGLVYFPANGHKRTDLKIFFSKEIRAQDDFVSFKTKKSERKPSSFRRRK